MQQLKRHIGKLLEIFGNEGLLTKKDLEDYRVEIRKPLQVEYRNWNIYTNPPPSSGGALIAISLKLLEPFDLGRLSYNSSSYLKLLSKVIKVTDKAREEVFLKVLYDEQIAYRFLSEENLTEYRKRMEDEMPGLDRFKAQSAGNTTHISVIDDKGKIVGCGDLRRGGVCNTL